MRSWFITGISTGFGRVMAEKLLSRGDRVAGTLRELSAADDLKGCFGDQEAWLWRSTVPISSWSASAAM